MQRTMQRNATYGISLHFFITEKYCEKVPKKIKKTVIELVYTLGVNLNIG